jgi:hypothetical protein
MSECINQRDKRDDESGKGDAIGESKTHGVGRLR